MGDGLGNFTPGPQTPLQNPFLGAVADLNSDSKSDVVLTTVAPEPGGPGGAHMRLLLGDGAGALAESSAFPVAASFFAPAVVQDLDADGRPDVLLGGPAGATVLQVLSGDGSRGLRPAVDAGNRVAPWRRLATASTNDRGVAEVNDQPRVSSEYQWRPTGRGKGRIKPTRRVRVRVIRRAETAG